MITTLNMITAPEIRFQFSPDLLLDFLGRIKMRMEEIEKLKTKKIREIDVGRKREFEILMKRYGELYGRKKVEEEALKAEIKKKNEKRPDLSAPGSVMRFRRFCALERASDTILL